MRNIVTDDGQFVGKLDDDFDPCEYINESQGLLLQVILCIT